MSPDAQVEKTADAIRRLVAEIAGLARADIPRQAFFKEFIVRAVRAIDAQGGAVWIGRDGRVNLIADVDLASSQFTSNPAQRDGIRAALRWVQEHGRSLIISPMGPEWPDEQAGPSGIPNHTPMAFFYVPIKVGGQAVGAVQVWQRPGRDPKSFRAFVEFLIQVTLYAESYLESRQIETVVRETQRLEQLLLLTERIASSETCREVALQAANLGRELVSADRLTVLETRGRRRCRALAVSGQARVERRAEMVRAIEGLACAAVHAADARAFRRPPSGEDTSPAARRYFLASSYDTVVLMPLRRGDQVVGVLAAEYPAGEGTPGDADLATLESLARQVGPALAQRAESEAMPLRRTARMLASLRPRSGRRRPVVLALVALAVLAAAFIPVTTSIEGRCIVWPTGRAGVVAMEGGRVTDVLVGEGQKVEAGRPLIRLESPTLLTSLEIARREVDRRRAEAQRCEAAGDPSGAQIATAYAEKAEGEVAYLRQRIAALTLTSPISGTVLTPDPASRRGDVLQRGDRILDVADLDQWEVVIHVPEKQIVALEEALDRAAGDGGMPVEFILASQPDKVLRARVTSRDQISPAARPVGGENVFIVRAAIPHEQLADVELRLRYEGRARIEGRSKSLLSVAADPFVDFLRMAFF